MRKRRSRRKSRRKDRQIENYKLLLDYLKAHPCVDCGISELVLLQFDHVKGRKVGNVTSLAYRGASQEKLVAEIAKCEVRCANCHVRKTAQRRGWARLNA